MERIFPNDEKVYLVRRSANGKESFCLQSSAKSREPSEPVELERVLLKKEEIQLPLSEIIDLYTLGRRVPYEESRNERDTTGEESQTKSTDGQEIFQTEE